MNKTHWPVLFSWSCLSVIWTKHVVFFFGTLSCTKIPILNTDVTSGISLLKFNWYLIIIIRSFHFEVIFSFNSFTDLVKNSIQVHTNTVHCQCFADVLRSVLLTSLVKSKIYPNQVVQTFYSLWQAALTPNCAEMKIDILLAQYIKNSFKVESASKKCTARSHCYL